MEKNALIIFRKNEVLGNVKTRIAAKVGDQKALEIYQYLVDHTLHACRSIASSKFIYYSDFIPTDSISSHYEFKFEIQAGFDLGSKMQNAFQNLFDKGFENIILIGTDCAELEPRHIEEAFELLESHEAVLGPAKDGGYYLVGLKRQIPGFFEGIPWSTSKVLLLTLEKLEKQTVTYGLLDLLSDIDEWEDWEDLNQKKNKKA
jgi:rSAM/selenodomain-associated transferase 1